MTNGTEEWRKGGVASPLGTDALSRPREVGEFYDFYKRWNSQIFAFCLLVCGDRGKAEWLTEQAFGLYFRCADFVALHECSHVPVALLRFASDLAEADCSQRSGARSCGHTWALLALPFKQRAVFILVSILSVPHSVAAVALRLRSSQLAACWIDAALLMRWFWLKDRSGAGKSSTRRLTAGVPVTNPSCGTRAFCTTPPVGRPHDESWRRWSSMPESGSRDWGSS